MVVNQEKSIAKDVSSVGQKTTISDLLELVNGEALVGLVEIFFFVL